MVDPFTETLARISQQLLHLEDRMRGETTLRVDTILLRTKKRISRFKDWLKLSRDDVQRADDQRERDLNNLQENVNHLVVRMRELEVKAKKPDPAQQGWVRMQIVQFALLVLMAFAVIVLYIRQGG